MYQEAQWEGLSEGGTIRLWRIRAHLGTLPFVNKINLYERSYKVPASIPILPNNLAGANLCATICPGTPNLGAQSITALL